MRNPVFLGGGDVASAAARARSLAADLSRLAAGGRFGPAVLADVPVIDDWSLDFLPSVIVRGRVSGHPLVPDGDHATCATVALDIVGGWSRSFDALYRLGRPRRPGDL